MALLFADGFEDGTAAWTLANSMALGTGRFGNGLVSPGTTSSGLVGFPATVGPVIVGFAFKPAGAGYIGGFAKDAFAFHVGLSRGASGEIIAFRLSVGTVLGTSATGVLPTGAWSYIEMKATISDTVGIVVVRVNGVQVLNLTAQDTANSTPVSTAGFYVGTILATGGFGGNAWDDLYICDATGTVNNDFLGELTVEHLRPASDDTAQWLGSDANSVNNWDLVDEAGAYNGADYVASSTVGQRDLYVPVPSARASTSPVLGVVVAAIAQKTDAGTRTVKLDVKEGSGGAVRQGADQGLPTSFGELRQVFERKGDGSQFTVADVNALRVGIEVST